MSGHKQPILVFDVNETLLDLSALDPVFAEVFGDAGLRRTWFAKLLHWSTVTTLTGRYRDFSALAADCLTQLAAEQRIEVGERQRQQIFAAIATLPPHAEVPGALARLAEQGFRLLALTNSAPASVEAQFANAGLAEHFERVLSVDAARAYKPHPDAYRVAARAAGVEASALCLVAAHDWDVTGAVRAGWAGAFVARGGVSPNPAGETPTVAGADLAAVAERLIERF